MRSFPTLRGLGTCLLALYVGVGIGAPVADAVVFHLGKPVTPIRPSIDDGSGSDGLHNICLLGQQARETITPGVASPRPATIPALDRVRAHREAPPRDAAPAGLPLSRAPPRV